MKEKIEAVIFDVDGLILDSEKFYAKAWSDAFNSKSPSEYQVDEASMVKWFYKNLSGKKIGNQLDMIQKTFKHNNIPEIYDEYRRLFKARLLTESIEVREGFFDLLKFLKQQKTKIALASTSMYVSIQNALQNANIDMFDFDVVVCGDLGLDFKPSPAPYLKACELLSVDPTKAISFEDSNSGVISSANANVKCFLIPGRAPVFKDVRKKAYAVCKTLSNSIKVIKSNFEFG